MRKEQKRSSNHRIQIPQAHHASCGNALSVNIFHQSSSIHCPPCLRTSQLLEMHASRLLVSAAALSNTRAGLPIGLRTWEALEKKGVPEAGVTNPRVAAVPLSRVPVSDWVRSSSPVTFVGTGNAGGMVPTSCVVICMPRNTDASQHSKTFFSRSPVTALRRTCVKRHPAQTLHGNRFLH